MADTATAPAPAPLETTAIAEAQAALLEAATPQFDDSAFVIKAMGEMDDPPPKKDDDPPPTGTPAREPAPKPKKGDFEVEKVSAKEIPDEPHGNTSEEGKIRWKELKALAADREAQLASVKEQTAKELTELREQLAAAAEAVEKAKRVDEIEREFAVHRIESSREFKEIVAEPLMAIEARTDKIAAKYETSSDAILNALGEPDPDKRGDMLEKVVEGMSRVDENTVLRMAEDTQALLSKRSAMRQKAAEAAAELDRITGERETKVQAEHRKALEASTAETVAALKDRIPFVATKDRETAEIYWAGLEKKVRESEFNTSDPKTLAFAKTAAVLLPPMRNQIVHLQAKLDAAEKRIVAMAGAAPTTSPGGGEPSGGGALPTEFPTLVQPGR